MNDRPHGRGVETFKLGSYYKGEFRNGKKEGLGRYVSSSGSVYEGEFRNELFDG